MKRDVPHILLVNPWIHDFAAFDFWAKPLGLLTIASLLRSHGLTVSYLDCLDRFHSSASKCDPQARYGRGPYFKTRIARPQVLDDVPRHFSRYGIKPQWFREDLLRLTPPDLVLVTSLMTYWYPGVQETIDVIKSIFPQSPVVLGGIYARLCRDHAMKLSGVDHVAAERAEENLFSLLERFTGFSIQPQFDPEDLDCYPYPALDLQSQINYVPLLTSRGCPFSCAYCASSLLEPRCLRRSPLTVIEEIRYWHETFGLNDFVLYDDAFLVDAEEHAIPVLEGIVKAVLKVRFHTPNAVHIRGITQRTAELMAKAGFTTLRLGLETDAFESRQEFDHKVSAEEFKRAATCLKAAGFEKKQVGAYLLVGLPDQIFSDVVHSIQTVIQHGLTPVPAFYAPIPHTPLWPQAVRASRYDLESDPIYTNNAIMPCRKEAFSWQEITLLKELCNR